MDTNKKSLSSMATGLYCQLADIQNIINVTILAAYAEEDKDLVGKEICWSSMISLLKNEVDKVLRSAENLESHINGKMGG